MKPSIVVPDMASTEDVSLFFNCLCNGSPFVLWTLRDRQRSGLVLPGIVWPTFNAIPSRRLLKKSPRLGTKDGKASELPFQWNNLTVWAVTTN